jgi:hypothetical protein
MLAAGHRDRAMALFDRALASYEEPDVGHHLADVQRVPAGARPPNKDEARQAFVTAQRIARRQGTVISERRAEVSLVEVANI